ncbi:GAF domain-containing protein [Herbidospora cretacea]|uniref:GAF domain-containing protein n=1 Tax=Herbidospora cretacea TaxID=28444 RepID=UPI0004C4625F|nr:GAF domain-containing protein [Herbidospora cretacea]
MADVLDVEQFLDGKLARDEVRAPILNSWQRCQAAGLTPETVRPRLSKDLDFDCELVRAARPVFDRLRTAVADTPAGMFLGDATGVMFLRNVGDRAQGRALDAVGAAPGFSYAEPDIGTTALGSALVERRTCRVSGNEHFSAQLHGLTAVATPIRNPLSGHVAGVISITCPNDRANEGMAALAHQSAAGVEQRLLELSSEHERALMEEFLRGRSFTDGTSVPSSACRDLCRRDRLALEDAAVRLVAQGRGAVVEVTLSDGRIATLLAQPMSDSTAIAVEVWFTGA